MIIDVRDVIPDHLTALVVSHPTGVWYEVQAGGMACMHPECEGFVVSLGEFMMDFNDCKGLCGILGIEETDPDMVRQSLHRQMEIGQKIDKALREYTAVSIRFDFERVNELMEGWWPVLVTGNLNSIMVEKESRDWIGYIHTNNCD